MELIEEATQRTLEKMALDLENKIGELFITTYDKKLSMQIMERAIALRSFIQKCDSPDN